MSKQSPKADCIQNRLGQSVKNAVAKGNCQEYLSRHNLISKCWKPANTQNLTSTLRLKVLTASKVVLRIHMSQKNVLKGSRNTKNLWRYIAWVYFKQK